MMADFQCSSQEGSAFPNVRLRRLRQHPRVRALVREYSLNINDLVLPIFVKAKQASKTPISALPGHFQWGIDDIDELIAQVVTLQIPAIILFGIPSYKDAVGSAAYADQGIIQLAIQKIRQLAPELLVITDLCYCEYTDHGHCGVLNATAQVDNDATLQQLAVQALSHARAGADIIAPSGMMDGVVQYLRHALDAAGYHHVLIMSYAVKYASAFYGPFRIAAESSPHQGDRCGYQLDPANAAQGLREAQLDVQEGADVLMVKPAQSYLDMIYRVKQTYPGSPLAAYQVSGEYAMIKAASMQGWLDLSSAMHESLLAIKRAGADFIITYFALEAAHSMRVMQ